jgi:alkaline phosphatase D
MPYSRRLFARSLSTAGVLAAAKRNAHAQSTGVFQHGVASGDPLANRVILWTRISPNTSADPLPVEWIIAEDPQMTRVQQRGITYTNALWDYTVKVDVSRLRPGATYYYQFRAQGADSPIGRTRTLPLGSIARLRYAFASCSNFAYGFFNAYRGIARRLTSTSSSILATTSTSTPTANTATAHRWAARPSPRARSLT